MRRWIIPWAMVVVPSLSSNLCLADIFHYNNVLIGDRASGMGGAFTAIADDASGVFYNPAGLGFALSNEISGSANALYTRNIRYKKAALGKDFVEKSSGTFAPFVGLLGKIDHVMPGLVWAFGMYTIDTELKDQDDLIEASTVRFHRTANLRAATNVYSVAVGKRLGSQLAIGGGFNLTVIDELAQVYQDSASVLVGYKTKTNSEGALEFEKDAEGKYVPSGDQFTRLLTKNFRERLSAMAFGPTLGVQFAPMAALALGFTVKYSFILAQKYEAAIEQTTTYLNNTTGKVVAVDDAGVDCRGTGTPCTSATDPYRAVLSKEQGEVKDPLAMPLEVRAGAAWFASSSLVASADIIYHGEAKGKLSNYDRDPVMDFAVGAEWYAAPSWPLRFGLFTNNDSRPKPESGNSYLRDSIDSIDYLGASIFVSLAQPNSQVSLGLVHQMGTGKARKNTTTTSVQDVEAEASTVGLTVSHNF